MRDLAQAKTEPEESCDLPSTLGRPRKAAGVIPVQTQRASESWRGWPTQLKQGESIHPSSAFLFYSGPQGIG